MSTEVRTFEYFVDLARVEVQTDITNGWTTVEEIEAQVENGDYLEVSSSWADAQNVYVYTSSHRDLYAAGVLDDHLYDAEDILSGSGESGPTVEGMGRLLRVAVLVMLEEAHGEGARQAVEAVKMAAEYAAEQAREVTA